jgi:hypothetical protein
MTTTFSKLGLLGLSLWLGLGMVACAGGDDNQTGLSGDMVMRPGFEDDQAGVDDECMYRAAGCPCYTEGEELDCGRIYRQSGDYVSCSIGSQTCSDGVWGECIGDQMVELGHDDVPPSYLMAENAEQ